MFFAQALEKGEIKKEKFFLIPLFLKAVHYPHL